MLRPSSTRQRWAPSRAPLLLVAALPLWGVLGCATSSSTRATMADGTPAHGTLSQLSTVEGMPELCSHRVPEAVCTRHHPEKEAEFKRVGDWCGEHGVPESQCLLCHPDLTFEPLPKLPDGADLTWLSRQGEDVPDLAPHLAAGKVTVFDFYADWCAPCRKVDLQVYRLLQTRQDLAVRKLNVVSWETPLARRHLKEVAQLPYLRVYDRAGKHVGDITGIDLQLLERTLGAQGTP